MYQTTILRPVSCYGIGVHSGKTVQLTLKPAKANAGIVFIRTDIQSQDNYIKADFEKVSETSFCTTISSDNKFFQISTIEHLLAAIWGSGIDNIIIEIDGTEVPIMDGSSKPFVFMLDCAQTKYLKEKRKYLKINKEIIISQDSGSENILTPSTKFSINIDIDFKSKAIGKQSLKYDDRAKFNSEIAGARTFGFIHELDKLKEMGLARGASLDNAIGLDKDVILNHDGLRYENEFVKHKLLDAIGDFSLASGNIIGSFICKKPGHNINNLLLRKVFDNKSNYSWVSYDEI
jgi:UDP-3-O-[3-hydroxymyristoyl] N-acetylglucosamine deacetylase